MPESMADVSDEIVNKLDELPEAAESFLVNITSVIVRGVTPPAGAEPSVKVPGNILTITVRENDGIRGMVQFNVTTNIEGRVDVYEEYGKNTTVKLKVSRSIGNLGDVILSWQAEPNEATTQDFYPSVGSIHLKDGQDNAEIIINIIDDTIAENMETFNVRLLGITSGGSVLGSKDSVRVAILKNDSPNGLFRFTQSTVNVRESRSANDQQGEVTLTVERIQGTDGVVNVQWRLNAEAFFDFMEPRSGTLLFAEGQSTKRITLRTKPDSILEGEEQFRVSLISADNNADISHTQGDATIVVQADPGARGTISILPEYRKVYIGEPGESSPSYDGQVQIKITRGLGIYGSIAVTWSLTPRETSAFLQVEGLVSLADLQQTAFITLQSIDDTLPENRTVYDFHITSATGGATVSTDTTANMANVIFVASDHPHGLFQFTLPQIQSVMEDSDKVNIPIIRTAGSEYPVLVSYTTTPGTAQSYSDFYPSVSTVEFQQGDIRKMIEIRIIQDDEPEGPEMFYVNLTSVRLLTPGKNNYTIVNGLQLDMKPAIGPISVKTILINKNDNAEGTVEFDSSAANFRVSEESGLAQIPLIRTGGNYGDVTIMYSTLNITATPDVDYVISQNQVSMLNGRRNVTIDITIRDDSEMEFDETFEIHLLSVSGGALLGQRNKSIVTIVKSDYPNGNFGFKGQLEFKFANPERQIKQSFTIERKGGLQGQQKVLWRIMGPNNPLQVLEATNDISHVADNKEVTSGSLTWNNGETGDKSFILDIKPFTSWEIQKTFVIEIHQIHGSPSGVGDGEISITTGKSTVTIEKFGDPNGIVRFQGLAQTERLVDEPEGITPLQLQFPISRREGTGTTGSIQIKWSVDGPYHVKFPDFQPQNGSIVMGDGQRDSVIVLQVLPDSVPELTESFKLVLKSVIGGAEIDTQFNTSSFKIKYNNHPHGLFGVQQRTQSLYVDPADLNRYVRINITRYFGLFGSVYVTYNIKYDQPLSGIIPSRSSGGVQFNDSVPTVTTDVLIGGDGFLELDSTFTITLTQVQFLGAGVTEPPKFKTGETEVKVRVPAFAANSEVGFQDTLASIDEVTGTSVITLTRIGQYGTISVPWKKGFPSTLKPQNFEEGQINPASGSVTIQHGVKTKNFTVSTPSTAARGGARLSVTKSLVKLEPHGIIRFAPNSTNPSVSEMDSTISLLVQRVYGSEGKIEIGYRSVEISATKLLDFTTTETNALILNPGVTSGLITLQVIQDNMPEEEEFFSVNLTHVEKYPTEIVPKISPRLSYISANSLVRIKESNDAYGVLCLEPTSVVIQEEFRKVNLTIRRTGGLYGSVSVIVRSVGGGETWTSQIVPDENPNTNDTIRQILGSRSSTNVAIGGQDYELVNTKVTFKQSEQVKFVSVTVLSDETAEPDESIIIYLTQPTGGARIAKGAPDGGKKGYAVITIEQNDLSNGIIGFSTGSKALTVNEDSSPVITLTLTRTNAYYDKVTVVWIAKWSENSTTAQDSVLAQELETTAGEFSCPATPRCSFDVRLKNDSRPEEEQHFIIKLLKVYRDAQLDIYSTTANITVEPSDYVRGLIQFTNMSRVTVIGKNERNVRLWVERIKGNGYNVTVGFQTDMMTSQESVYGITINPALENQDYMRNTGTLIFLKHRQEIKFIDINMTPINADKNPNPLPRQFYVILKNPSNGASIHPDISHSRAIIRIVEDADVSIWKEVHKNIGSLNNDENILSTLSTLDKIAKTYLDETEMALMESILKNIIEEGLKRELSDDILNQLLNVLCNLMNPNKADATRGRNSLSVLMESLAYAMLTGKPCPSPSYPRLKEFQCAHAKISGGRWPLQQIQGFQYNAQRKDTFKIPSVIMNPPTPVQSNCSDFHMTEYSSEQWFMTTNEKQLLSSKILAFGIKGKRSAYNEDPARFVIHTPDRRIAAKYAQCVYFDFSTKSWDPSGHCTVNNNLELAQDDYVDCSCRHLTHYAVKGFGESLTGYPTAFYVASFICMIALILAILVHHVYSTVHAMFSASLLMHMIFACFATQLCYVVAAYTSPSEVLVTSLDQDNYRCIVMGLFLHYFFLTQFTWIFSQTINFWKILVMNDEHTDTKYVIFFLIGWGSPLVILAIFYAVTYNLYKYVYNMPVNFIYGDVNNNGQMCFITNGYAALGGVIAPVIFILLFVAVVFVRAFQVTPQWQAYDDIYRGRYNINEVRTLLSFWFIVALTWLWGGLHLAFGQLWMLVMYCIFNILEGLLVIVLYTILRNPCIQQCFGPQKKAYSMSTENLHENGSLPVDFHHTFTTEIASLKGSTASVVNEEWERDDSTMPSKSTTMKVKRTLPSSGNIYVTPPVLERPLNEGEDFHDFLHALKNQESSSDVESLVSEKMSDVSSNVDRYEMRRISIADTHL